MINDQQHAQAGSAAQFDDFADNYRQTVDEAINFSGESIAYFASTKVECLKEGMISGTDRFEILDFGCGIGEFAALLANAFKQSTIYGYDPSLKSIAIAKQRAMGLRNLVFLEEDFKAKQYDFIVVSNVFHHVKKEERISLLLNLKNALKANGRIVIFEHNPLNPLTRYVVKICPFDQDACLLWKQEFFNMAKSAALNVISAKYLVFFPSFLKFFRALDSHLRWCPLGAQYAVMMGNQN